MQIEVKYNSKTVTIDVKVNKKSYTIDASGWGSLITKEERQRINLFNNNFDRMKKNA